MIEAKASGDKTYAKVAGTRKRHNKRIHNGNQVLV